METLFAAIAKSWLAVKDFVLGTIVFLILSIATVWFIISVLASHIYERLTSGR
jgi:hypothetical protein